MTGTRIGKYRILEKLGQGGMGEVYKAEDTRLKRLVAIKVLRKDLNASGQGRLRFLREARAVSALSHPNIVQIFEMESQDGCDFIAMEFVAGPTLTDVIRGKQLSVETAVDYAGQLASALAAAHEAGIVHRDIKPGNIMVSDGGIVKVLDFGLARVEQKTGPDDSTLTAGPQTVAGTILGTSCYMSPEQAEGKPVDARSDIFSTGAVFYEMLTGVRAFDGESTLAILSKVMRDSPRGIQEMRADVPVKVARIVNRCLEKDPAVRYPSGRELAADLAEYRRPAKTPVFTMRARLLTAAVVVASVASAGWMYYRWSRARWARNEALPKIEGFIARSDIPSAFDLTRTALRYAPDDPQLKQYWSEDAAPISLTTTPPGAKVFYRPYGQTKAAWRLVGETPFENASVPLSYGHVRLEKTGWEPEEFATDLPAIRGQNIPLAPAGKIPAGMVLVRADSSWMHPNKIMPLPDYLLDKYEVTNGQFRQFIDAGGYREAKYWQEKFQKEGREIAPEQAIEAFRDKTGQPGPSGRELGSFPKGQSDFPVGGVSWFEADAYCRYAGKALPTVHHWRKAAGFGIYSDILLFSNFSSAGPARVGANAGISAYGAYDMAGNVKEWNSNQAGNLRAILGGGWTEPSYAFLDADARDPFERDATFGFRCAMFTGGVPAEALAPIGKPVRDYSKEKPVGDETFEVVRRMYAYDKTPVEAKTESVDDSNEYWRKEKVSYRAAYGAERIPAYLYLPKNAKPPFQTVVWFPGGYAFGLRDSTTGTWAEYFNFLLRTGRAVLYPVYKGTFERHTDAEGESARRELTIQIAKDIFRSVDYLESRADIQSDKLGYYGISTGAYFGGFALALEPRFKAAVLGSGGLSFDAHPAETDVINFVPRIHIPVLMINGRNDFEIPATPLQEPMFRLLGSPENEKRYAIFDAGHVPLLLDITREVLSWFDRYLGPVNQGGGSANRGR
jgi:dienelactone hydrolase